MTEQQPQRSGIEEKGEEKQQEKMTEKSYDEKWRRDPLSAAVWAMILIWAGLALLIYNLDLLEDLPYLSQMSVWSLIFAGAGIILLLEVLIRLVVPAYRGPVIGTTIVAVIFLGIGLGELVNFAVLAAILVIVIGVLLLFRGLRGEG
jgi:hypothetical protein